MIRSVARSMAVLSIVVGCSAVPTTPARATTVLSGAFVGELEVTGGMGYSVLTLALQVPSTTCSPLADELGAVPNCHPVYDHLRAASLRTVVCSDVTANLVKAKKPLVNLPGCSFDGGGTVTGHCDMAGGELAIVFTDGGGQTYDIQLHFTTVAFKIVMTGHVTKRAATQQRGLLVGYGHMVPPVSTFDLEDECLVKTGTRFLMSGFFAGATA